MTAQMTPSERQLCTLARIVTEDRTDLPARGLPLSLLSDLKDRHRQVLDLLAEGLTNGQIARRLGLSEGTIRTHLESLYRRLGVSSRAAAVTRAFPGRYL